METFGIQTLSGTFLGYLALEVKGFTKISRLMYLMMLFGLFLITSINYPGHDLDLFPKEVRDFSGIPVLVIGGSSYVGHRVYILKVLSK